MTPPEEIEARITALLLGELSAEEANSLRQSIAQDSEWSRLHDRLKQAIGLVRETAASPEQENLAPPDAPKLSSERRAALLAAFKVVIRPKELVGAGRSRFAWRELVAVAAMIVILCLAVAIIAPNFIRARGGASQRPTLFVVGGETWAEGAALATPLVRGEGGRVSMSGQSADRMASVDYFAGGAMPDKEAASQSIGSGMGQQAGASVWQAKPKSHSSSVVTDASLPPPLALPSLPSEPPAADARHSGDLAMRQFGNIALPAPDADALSTSSEDKKNGPTGQSVIDLNRSLFTDSTPAPASGQGGAGRGGGGGPGTTRPAEYAGVSTAGAIDIGGGVNAGGTRSFGVTADSPPPVEQAWAGSLIGAPVAAGNVQTPAPAAGAKPAEHYFVFSDSLTPAPVPARPARARALPQQAPLRLGDNDGGVKFKAGVGIEPITVITNVSAVGSGFYSSIGSPLLRDGSGGGIGGIAGQAVDLFQRPEAGITVITPTLEPEPFGGRGDQNTAAPTQINGGADGYYRSVPSRQIRTGTKDAREESLYAEGNDGVRDLQRESGLKSDDKAQVTQQSEGRVPARMTEIALPDSERGETKETLQIPAGPVVVSEIHYNDPTTGLPPQGQADLSLSVEEARRRQVERRPSTPASQTPAPQVAPVEKAAVADYKLTDRVADEPAKEGSAEVATLTRELDRLRSVRDRLAEKVVQEKADALIPKTGIVEIVDRAESESSSKPTVLERVRKAWSGGVERSARIAVQKDATDIQGMSVEAGRSASFDPYWVQTESEKIQSKSVLDEVATRLKLNQTWAETHGGGTELTGEETYRLLKKKVDARSDPKSGLIDIRVKSDSPEEAARIANTIAEVYRDARREKYQQMSARGAEALETAVVERDNKIARVQQELERRKKELSVEQAQTSSLYFEDADLSQILDRYEELTGRTVLRPIKLPEIKVTINDWTSLSRDAAIRTLGQVLSMNGITMVPQGDPVKSKFIKALAEPRAGTAGQQLNDLPHELLPDSGTYVTHVVQLTNTSPNDVLPALQPFAKAPNSILTIPTNGLVVLRDYAENVKRMVEVLAKVDAGGKVDEKREDLALARRATAPIPQPEVTTTDNAFSTFSLNVSDVSFKLAAASLEKGQMPDPATVRSEEFINAFDYRDPEPQGSAPIAFAWERARYPFAHDRDLLRFSVKTAASGRQPGRPLNLVLLLDNSGSMERADRVRIRQECLRVLAGQLQPQDRISVVAFARTPRLWVDGLPGNQAGELSQRVGSLAPEGGTNLEDAMNVAYQTALKHFLANGVNRVVLLTDGAANLGDVEPESLKKKVEAHRKQGVALDCFGIGWDGLNDELLESLSRNGDGRYGFVNTPEAATTEFAGQLAGALKVAASDVKVQVEWNPRRVTAYRQIGYAKHQLKKEQFRDNAVDAAEIGAAEAGNALYVAQVNPRGEGPLGTVRVRFKVPATGDYREHEWAVPYEGASKPLEQSSPAIRLAASASAFSEWLVSSPFAAEVTPDRLLGHLSGVPEIFPADPRPKKLEWMIRQARSVAGK